MELDLGGIAKGYAVDRAADIMRADGVTAALISSGTSSIYALGSPPGEHGWRQVKSMRDHGECAKEPRCLSRIL
jgi:thiamine biosynthesis lipoprotein